MKLNSVVTFIFYKETISIWSRLTGSCNVGEVQSIGAILHLWNGLGY